MANPTTMRRDKGTHHMAEMVASGAAQSILLDPDRRYSVAHLGLNVTPVADTATIYLSFLGADEDNIADATVTNAGGDKLATLLSGWALELPPGLSFFSFISTAAPRFLILPSGLHNGNY